jgi:hypothetical protein
MDFKAYPCHRESGQAILIAVFFFLVISLTIFLGITTPTLHQIASTKETFNSRRSLLLAEAALDDVYHRLQKGESVGAVEVVNSAAGIATTTITTTATGKRLVSTANVNNDIRSIQADITLGTGIAFHYGIQAGDGGLRLNNSSSVTGNIHASGPIIGANGNWIYGDVVSAGASGVVYGVHATGSAYAHTIGAAGETTVIDRNAYYQTVRGSTTVAGSSYPGTADQATSSLPISDEQISEWEADAEAGGVLASSECDSFDASGNTCTISSNKTIGPKKVPFNLLIKSSSGILTVAGPLWVTGNVTAQTGPTIQMAPDLGGQNVPIIADDPSNRPGSGLISIGQSTTFRGSGTPGSFVFMISQNNSGETGGTLDAISMNQGASALVAYASHGQITLSQSVSVKEVTAYRIVLTQSANVTYDTGLPSTLFSGGPSGGYSMLDWKEI